MKKFISGVHLFLLLISHSIFGQQKDTVYFNLSLSDVATHIVHVAMQCNADDKNNMVFKMPQWTPGYYQIMHYANHVTNFEAGNGTNALAWKKENESTWMVETKGEKNIVLKYDVIADSPFVATSFADTSHAYLTPAATFLYIDKKIKTPVSLVIEQYKNWGRIATGLDSIANKPYTYTAPDFDMLFDCPILAGNLEELPSFTMHGIPHRFIGYNMGEFDKVAFMIDLKKIVEAGVSIMQDIPYKHYTFLAIGPGNGGIEHLTSSANSFDGNTLNTDAGRKRMLTFLAHEYFHNYNVKRIRPVELGPFDYDKGSKTNQLWISEGWTVYYEYLITQRSGIIADTDVYKLMRGNILAYEKHQGKNHQSLVQSSAETWSDGPFGNDPDKTISYYTKGPVVALMLDFAIRHYTNNRQSLDDVMRKLYNDFYRQQNHGFTEAEFRQVAESVAGKKLDEIFSYVYTTRPLDYKKYFNYGGLDIEQADQSFYISPLKNPDALQAAIWRIWLGR
ncbi:M61 family metallopeptidase [Parafilimonas sp.]|uniref:M61 family metallopeptidase n=1 Tax=Parafilimonas sp. TaxID=1969739 RepID=UPI0039E31400